MTRFRSRFKVENRQKSIAVSNTGLTVTRITDSEVNFESMSDRLSRGYPDTMSNNPLSYTSVQRVEAFTSATGKDLNGARSWDLKGNLTQFFIGSWYPSGIPAWPSVSLPTSAMTQIAQQSALAGLDRPDGNFGEPIAELRTFDRDIKRPVSALDRMTKSMFKRFRQNRFYRTIDHFKALSDVYAQYAFNIGPTLRTIDDACDVAARAISRLPPASSTHGRYEAVPKLSQKSTSGSASGWTWIFEQTRILSYEVHATIRYVSSDRASTSGRLGLRPRDLLVTAYEVQPLSFLVDRVINLKRFLRTSLALSSPSVKIMGASVSSKLTDRKACWFRDITTANPLNYWRPNTTQKFFIEDFSYDRNVWVPTAFDSVTRLSPSGLVKSLSSTLDLTAVILGRIS
jgi:hypothetical protein